MPHCFVWSLFYVPDSEVFLEEAGFCEVRAIHLIGVLCFQLKKPRCAVGVQDAEGAIRIVEVVNVSRLLAVLKLVLDVNGNGAMGRLEPLPAISGHQIILPLWPISRLTMVSDTMRE
jgi:hypothetical protein